MNVKSNSVYDILLRMRVYFQGYSPAQKYIHEDPLRSELLASEQMEQQGKIVAASHKLTTAKAPAQLIKRLSDNEKVLLEVRDLLVDAVKENKRITPAGEWVLDNFYLIEEHIVIGKRHLPKGYSQSLPRLAANGPSAGLPRVYDIALDIISHSDGRIDIRTLTNFVAAYQTVTRLTIGELWAIPIMLRLALIENLRRVAARIAMDKIDQELADYWAGQLIASAEKDAKNLILIIADMARSAPPLASPFVAEMTRQLQGKGPVLSLPLTWMEQQLSEAGISSNELVHLENQKQAADQVSISNSIGSLRFLGSTDWRDFVETLSSIDEALREDIDGVYSRMDFSTRDHYRHVVESVAKRSELTEMHVARTAIALAKTAANEGGQPRTTHVGYYLVDKGLEQLERSVNIQFSSLNKLQRWTAKHPLTFYVWPIILMALMFSAYAILVAAKYGMDTWLLPIIGLLTFVSSTHLAVSIVNWLATLLVKPQLLPRMDFAKGIPAPLRTLVAIPTMLTNKSGIAELAEALEVRYLANSDPHLHFALVTDFADALQEKMPDDDELLAAAKEAIELLNNKYKSSGPDIFFQFHRPRRWNPREGVWMGYERKRGKLSELNELLRGGAAGCFSNIVGDYSVLLNIRYIITLDTDTQLPRDAAWKFVATMAHPLNQAVYDEQKQRVTQGYGILQPRVAVSMPGSENSFYAQMHQNDSGLDPYTRVTSDVYQDLFGEGSFIGKGIYDVDIFEKALNNRFPENRILSHDLLEGCYTRCGLISDVQLYEEYPSTYRADVSRRHRWVRGDWQIAWWMLPWIPDKNRHLVPNKLSWLARWKIFDNIRRSLSPIALVTLLLLGWTILPMPWLWTLLVTSMLLLQTVMTSIWHVVHKPNDLILKEHLLEASRSAFSSLSHIIFAIACLPYEAYYNTDAIIRTNWRMLVTNRGLLEWTPSTSPKVKGRSTLLRTYRRMWVAPFLSIMILAYLCSYDPMTVIVAAPILILWAASPAISWYISLPLKRKAANLSLEQRIYLQKLARKTWAFFDRFVGAEDNWLPPDNYQENPVEVIAHRTSPTNIGLSMLSGITAYDFGYISNKTFLQRTSGTLDTIDKLEKYRGHLYNWYDTLTLQPLFPRYVSTVDSGNFAGHLITLRQGLFEILWGKIINPRIFEGISDTLYIVADYIKTRQDKLEKMRIELDVVRAQLPHTLKNVKVVLDTMAAYILPVYNEQTREADEGSEWIYKLYAQVQDILNDINELAPWLHIDMPVGFAFPELDNPSLADLAKAEVTLLPMLDEIDKGNNETLKPWSSAARMHITAGSRAAASRVALIEIMGRQCMETADMEYEFLYDRSKKLYRIGYNVEEHRNDPSYYDLLASEARLCVFVGIAQGKMEQESWFSLGRLLTNAGGDPILLSWSGSMFEYLMPLLVMPTYDNTLLDQTNKASVARQIEYGRQRGVPWGISESGYNTVDTNLNYQYRAFGVPGLGLKRGLGDDLVVAPYATMLALMVAPEEACRNLQALTNDGFEGNYGFFEAIDYTPIRLPRGASCAVIKSYMAHHQGMGLLSLSYLLLDKPMQRRFEAEPQIQATLLLLQERLPRATIFYSHTSDIVDTHAEASEPQMRIMSTPNTPVPEVHLLSNSRYQVVITNAGGGYSCWKDIAVTRWREDTTRDNWGMFCYIKDAETGEYWSNTYQPTLKPYKSYEAVFSMGHAEFRRRDAGIETYTEIVVSPEDDIEMRRLRITNRTAVRRVIEVTSYAEVVLATNAADMAHPAFSNLFVQTEIIPNNPAIICTRRKRNEDETPPWMFHLMTVNGADVEMVSYETDRMKFIGRGKTVANPQAMDDNAQLSGSEGSVLDPIVAIRYRIVLKPNQAVTVDMVLGIADTREVCTGLMEKYKDRHLKNRAFELSWTHSHVLLRQINALEVDAQLYSRLAGYIIYSNPTLRTDAAMINRNNRGQSGLWSYSISGDLPIVLLRVQDTENIEIVKQMVQAHAYWRLKGLYVDLVIWNEDHGSYRQLLQDQILGLITATSGVYNNDRPGNIFVRSVDQVSEEDRVLFQTVARVIINDSDGTLVEQINRRMIVKALPPLLLPSLNYAPERVQRSVLPSNLLFFNGYGGFTQDGKEYIIDVKGAKTTPAPWANVIANADFGTVISESGGAYTWAENAHEFRLTPWNNDPVSDTCGEAYYLRDEETGHYWSPTPAPGGTTEYIIRHGFGYSVFEHVEHGIRTEMWVYVDLEASIKFVVLKIKNLSGRARKLSATGYVEWVLGDLRAKNMMHVVTDTDPVSGAMFSRNRYNTIFADMVAFFDVDDSSKRTVTTDRTEFIGRNGTLQNPEAMGRTKLSNRVSSGLDPCTALQLPFDLYEDQEKEVIFRLGTGKNEEDARRIALQFKGSAAAGEARTKVHDYWNETLNAIQVETPDKALNLVANGWLTYQTLSSRIVARSGFYQSGGAWGFRDQLQDVISLVHAKPQLARAQILLCASRQFREGDVQHWWHPPTGRGVRTTCSDDFLWLPFITSRYVTATGDTGVLDEQVNYLEGRLLTHGEESYYDLPLKSAHTDTLYQHCVAAIRNGFKYGEHGLPLIGSGDWNDGMDKVGEEGKGESVWLAFFLYTVLNRFSVVAEAHRDAAFVTECKNEAEKLRVNVEQHAWDGEWYRRAYFDDGTPLGSSTNTECRIDSISQSWSVLSGAGEAVHAKTAMASVDKYLVRRDKQLIQLLDPPFDKVGKNPGYIRGYVPGVRENGGQYTHAAIWTIMAFAALGDNEKVWELFSMINPVNHGNNAAKIEIYKVEPYVVAADVYAVAPHNGRGGWTWYTGSAGWMYQLIVESVLGIKLEAGKLSINPCIPAEWDSFKLHYRFGNTYYHITVLQKVVNSSLLLVDNKAIVGNVIVLADDGKHHTVELTVVKK